MVTEARYGIPCYCALDWTYEAENVMRLVKEKDLVNKSLRLLYNTVHADYLVRTEQYEQCIPYLREAAARSSGSQKNRLWFLLAVYSRSGASVEAYEAFKKAGSGPPRLTAQNSTPESSRARFSPARISAKRLSALR